MKILYISMIVIVTSLALPTAFGSEVNTMPDPKFHAVLDKNSYQNSEKPLLSIFAKPNATVNLLVLDSHGLQKLDKTITLENGTVTYSLDISSYSPGICSVIVEEEPDEIKLDFAVGLSTTGGSIMLNTDKNSYFPGDNVTIFGWWQPNTMIQLSLIDPNGVSVKSMQIFSDKTGHLYSLNFSIPSTATAGTWKIHGTSGVSNVSVSLTVENIPGAQMVKNDLGDGNVFNIQAKDRGLPSDIIEINGNLVTRVPIKIILNDPNGIIRDSVTTFADRNGDFTSELKIPADATAGTWKIIGNSGIYHRELNFTVVGNSATETCYGLNCFDLNSTGITTTHPLIHGTNSTIMQSPLKQFKSGIKSEYVKCNQDLHLIIKADDGSFACVTIETGKNLAIRGWATTFNTGVSIDDYYTKCDDLYQQLDAGIPILYMPTNSIGKICVKYSNPNDTPEPLVPGIAIFNPTSSYQNATGVTIWRNSTDNMVPSGDSTQVYFVKTGNQTGLYGLRFSRGETPFAVGYDNNSSLRSSDFPFARITHSCPVMLYNVSIEGLTGIGERYIPYP